MRGSRLEQLGTVFSRTQDPMRSGVIKENEKPMWYEVYAAFRPKREPTYEKAQEHAARFVEKNTQNFKKAGEVSEDKLFEETLKALLVEDIVLRRAGTSGKSAAVATKLSATCAHWANEEMISEDPGWQTPAGQVKIIYH
ncbi:small ribosomal subunit protein mS23-like [Eleutherodactylus coqui]|uniref:small ribosomal subunit protein mS23-like n=1 Tax=Eleutherodactylus coqui TaxID=57060 RepID=UPI003461D98B